MQSMADTEQSIPNQRSTRENQRRELDGSTRGLPLDDESLSEDSLPDAFRTFTYAVLAKHFPNKSSPEICVCGSPMVLCEYTGLAKQILNVSTNGTAPGHSTTTRRER